MKADVIAVIVTFVLAALFSFDGTAHIVQGRFALDF
jgi:hypothetical protein